MTDDELGRQVAAELSWDPQVDSEVIVVSADSGTVTLRGTVDSLRDAELAEDLAQVVLHGAGADEQPGGDLPVGQVPGRHPGDLASCGVSASALTPDGLVMFAGDGRRASHELAEGPGSWTIQRQVPDGRRFGAVKVALEPRSLERSLRELGRVIEVKPLAGPLFPGLGGPSRLARHAVAEGDDSGAEGAGLDEFESHPALALGKERNAAAHQHRVDPGPVLVDQTQRGRRGGQSRAADRDVDLPGLGYGTVTEQRVWHRRGPRSGGFR